MHVHLVDGTYELFRHYHAVPPARDRDGHEVASTASSAWTAGLTLTAAPEVPLDQQVFLLWVALVTRRRNRSMAGI